jgi:hypothetical protein
MLSNGNFNLSFDPQNAGLSPLKKILMTFSSTRAKELAQN